jgi:hypothetical protein
MHMRAIAVGICLATSAAHADPQWLTVETMIEPVAHDAARGIRGEADLVSWHGWMFGVAASAAESTVGVYGDMSAELATTDLKAMAYVARAARFERWELRGSLGAGAIRTTATGDDEFGGMSMQVAQSRVFATAEASLRAVVPISPRWAVTGGPIVSYYGQTFEFVGNPAFNATTRTAELLVMAGLSYRL